MEWGQLTVPILALFWVHKTYFEDRRFEGTVIFGDRIKPNFAKVGTTLAFFAHSSL